MLSNYVRTIKPPKLELQNDCMSMQESFLLSHSRINDQTRWAWPASKRETGCSPIYSIRSAAEKHAAPIRLQTAYITRLLFGGGPRPSMIKQQWGQRYGITRNCI